MVALSIPFDECDDTQKEIMNEQKKESPFIC